VKPRKKHRLLFKRGEIHWVDCTSHFERTETKTRHGLMLMPGFVFSTIEGYGIIKVTISDYCCSARVMMRSPGEKLMVLDFCGFRWTPK
jgi:hypothetical protein